MVAVMRIKASDPVREGFSGRSTGNVRGVGRTGYYETKGHAIQAFDAELREYGYHLDHASYAVWSGDEGRETVDVCDERRDVVGCAVFTWYRMPSGRYEFIGYLA